MKGLWRETLDILLPRQLAEVLFKLVARTGTRSAALLPALSFLFTAVPDWRTGFSLAASPVCNEKSARRAGSYLAELRNYRVPRDVVLFFFKSTMQLAT